MRFLTPSLALALSLVTTACVIEGDSSLLVSNRSDFVIEEMYVTPVDSPTWGRNLLGGDVLFPGESTFITLESGTYDTMLVDETGAVCEVSNIDLNFEDADWIIRNNSCAVFEALAAAKATE